MQMNLIRRMAAFGIMGGLLMLFGDLCFYMFPVSGEEFLRASVMNKMPTNRLIMGGVAGPMAGMLYGLGAVMFYLAFKDHNRLLARIVTTLFVVMFVVGGAYHSIFTTYGFVPDNDPNGITDKITALIGTLQQVSFIAGLAGSLLFVYLVLRYDSRFPKWIVLFTPTFWTLLNRPIAPLVPYPAGSVIIGGWINLCFIVFFTLCFFLFSKPNSPQSGD